VRERARERESARESKKKDASEEHRIKSERDSVGGREGGRM